MDRCNSYWIIEEKQQDGLGTAVSPSSVDWVGENGVGAGRTG